MKIDKLYNLREEFTIIGLTGRTGSGCSELAEIISRYEINDEFNKYVRLPDEIGANKENGSSDFIFKQKYTICYNYFRSNHKKYTVLKYKDVVLFYALMKVVEIHGSNIYKFADSFAQLIVNNFADLKRNDISDSKIESKMSKNVIYYYLINYSNLKKLLVDLSELSSIDSILEMKYQIKLKRISEIFWSSNFSEFSSVIYFYLGSVNFYYRNIFINRLANKIRATDNIFSNHNEDGDISDAKIDNIFNLAQLINRIIKSYQYSRLNVDGTHIVIDSLRNSLEIMFFKERYSAFYMIAVHKEDFNIDTIKTRCKNNENWIDGILELDEKEYRTKRKRKGVFYKPDVADCIQKSEVHFANKGGKYLPNGGVISYNEFYTLAEQWMKLESLILHPGLITPTPMERLMLIAHNAKFNSGCISRQVGAVITDEFNSVRAIGWNDVPYGQIPCLLRNVDHLIEETKDELKYLYSPFENSKDRRIDYKKLNGKNVAPFSFKDGLKDYHKKRTDLKGGLNISYCFKTMHNEFEDEKNQVHTRSLHAEENAMLQISKNGGVGLKGGTLYTTASPCELCSKKAYQLGIKKIIYIDPYPGISRPHILENGFNQPEVKLFKGIIGATHNKLYEPFMSYKDELYLMLKV